MAGGDSLNVELASGDIERESSERYKGYVVRSRLKRVLNEAVKSNATAREEEVRRFPDRYIVSVKAPDGRLLRSGRKIRDAFRAHFRDRFARCTDLPLAAAVVWKKRLSTPSTTASEFARFGITSASGRLASNPNSSYCSTLVTSWTTFFLRIRVRSVWCFSRS